MHVINTVADPNVRTCVELIRMTRTNDFAQVDNNEIQFDGMCLCTFQVLSNPRIQSLPFITSLLKMELFTNPNKVYICITHYTTHVCGGNEGTGCIFSVNPTTRNKCLFGGNSRRTICRGHLLFSNDFESFGDQDEECTGRRLAHNDFRTPKIDRDHSRCDDALHEMLNHMTSSCRPDNLKHSKLFSSLLDKVSNMLTRAMTRDREKAHLNAAKRFELGKKRICSVHDIITDHLALIYRRLEQTAGHGHTDSPIARAPSQTDRTKLKRVSKTNHKSGMSSASWQSTSSDVVADFAKNIRLIISQHI